MLDQISFHYKTKRTNFGRPTSSFEDTESQMIMSVEPDHQMDINLELRHSCILNVPIHLYQSDFTFLVNGNKFKTSRLISDLLSPLICHIHTNDPTFDTFTINTHESGDFSSILSLVKFEKIKISEKEVPFILEVIKILRNDSIIHIENSTKITAENVFNLIKLSKISDIFQSAEIDFITSHFYELCSSHEEELLKIPVDTLYNIFSSNKLKIDSEDQLLNFINKLYSKDVNYSILYETVLFENTSASAIQEFTTVFDSDYITKEIWNRLVERLLKDINKEDKTVNKNRYLKQVKAIK